MDLDKWVNSSIISCHLMTYLVKLDLYPKMAGLGIPKLFEISPIFWSALYSYALKFSLQEGVS